MAWHVGDVWEPPVECVEGEPGSWTFTFQSPRGALSKPTPTKLKAQEWKAAQELTEPGIWRVSVTTTAPYKASQPAQISVKPAFEE